MFGGNLGILLLFLLLTQGGLPGGGDNMLFLLILFMLLSNGGIGALGVK